MRLTPITAERCRGESQDRHLQPVDGTEDVLLYIRMCLCAVGCIVYDCLLFVDPLLLPEHLEVCEDSLYRLPPADEVRVAGVHICLLDRCKICNASSVTLREGCG